MLSLRLFSSDDTLEKFTKFVKVMDDSVKLMLSVGESNSKKHETSKSCVLCFKLSW